MSEPVVYKNGTFAKKWRESLPPEIRKKPPIRDISNIGLTTKDCIEAQRVVPTFKKKADLRTVEALSSLVRVYVRTQALVEALIGDYVSSTAPRMAYLENIRDLDSLLKATVQATEFVSLCVGNYVGRRTEPLTFSECSHKLGVHRNTLRNWAKMGYPPVDEKVSSRGHKRRRLLVGPAGFYRCWEENPSHPVLRHWRRWCWDRFSLRALRDRALAKCDPAMVSGQIGRRRSLKETDSYDRFSFLTHALTCIIPYLIPGQDAPELLDLDPSKPVRNWLSELGERIEALYFDGHVKHLTGEVLKEVLKEVPDQSRVRPRLESPNLDREMALLEAAFICAWKDGRVHTFLNLLGSSRLLEEGAKVQEIADKAHVSRETVHDYWKRYPILRDLARPFIRAPKRPPRPEDDLRINPEKGRYTAAEIRRGESEDDEEVSWGWQARKKPRSTPDAENISEERARLKESIREYQKYIKELPSAAQGMPDNLDKLVNDLQREVEQMKRDLKRLD